MKSLSHSDDSFLNRACTSESEADRVANNMYARTQHRRSREAPQSLSASCEDIVSSYPNHRALVKLLGGCYLCTSVLACTSRLVSTCFPCFSLPVFRSSCLPAAADPNIT
eukprot:5398370-Pyramimonas_sp.AAC.1